MLPLLIGRIALKAEPICTVAPVASVSARRNARSCAVPASSIVAYRTVTSTLVLTGKTVGPEVTWRRTVPGVVVLVVIDVTVDVVVVVVLVCRQNPHVNAHAPCM